ncbi:MAG: hypothetical protein M3N28_02935 [Actinomycetota bacterium]|nr:hypothetical protein [Actinomycetota bacterium]
MLVLVLRVVLKAAATTAETAQAILIALEEVRASTAPLNSLGQFDPDPRLPGGNGSGAVDSGAEVEEYREKDG